MKSRQLAKSNEPVTKKRLEPFQKVKLEMGEYKFHYNTESSGLWSNQNNSEWIPPIGMRDYDSMSMKPVNNSIAKREFSCSERYSKVINNNPMVFYKKSGDFTNYIDSTIRVSKVGPFSKRLSK